MPAITDDLLPADEIDVFRDSALVVAVRQEWDELLVQALVAPGLGVEAAHRVVSYVTGPRLTEATEALSRIASWTQES